MRKVSLHWAWRSTVAGDSLWPRNAGQSQVASKQTYLISMTDTPIDTPAEALSDAPIEQTAQAAPDAPAETHPAAERSKNVQPVLQKLFELYPALFGAEFSPLQLGVFHELLARHPDDFERADLKAALGFHTRSTRYLQCVASGKERRDLDGASTGAVAPEHVSLSLLELFKRRQPRSRDDLRPKLRREIAAVFAQSGLTRQDYLAKIHTNDERINTLLTEALDGYEEFLAKQEALCRTFEASGQSVEAFADMYGMDPDDVRSAVAQKAAQACQTAPQ
jgi:ProP effector